jgi:DNA primase
LTEGQLDCLRCWECGLTTAVAAQGTAVTLQHLGLLRRYGLEMECLLDGDDAGRTAALRLIPIAFRAGIDVRLLTLPSGQDPDTFFLAEGAEGMKILRPSARSAMEYLVDCHLPAAGSSSYAHRREGLKNILETVAAAESRIVERSLLDQLARLTGIAPEVLQADHGDGGAEEEVENSLIFTHSGEYLLHAFLTRGHLRNSIAETAMPEWLDDAVTAERLLNRLIGEWQNGRDPETALAEFEEEDRNYAYGLMLLEPDDDEIQEKIDRCVRQLHRNHLLQELAAIDGVEGDDASRRRRDLRRTIASLV